SLCHHRHRLTLPIQDHIVPVDQFRVATVAENGFDFTALPPEQAPRLVIVIGDEATPKLSPLAILDDDRIAPIETALEPRHPGGQEALARAKRVPGALVDEQRALWHERSC